MPMPVRYNRRQRGCSSMVEQKLPKLTTRVRFPSPAPFPLMIPSRTAAIASATTWFDAGSLQAELRRRVAFPTESQNAARAQTLVAYLTDEIAPSVERLGFAWQLWPNPVTGAPPMLFAERQEDRSLPTVLIYGHVCGNIRHSTLNIQHSMSEGLLN